MKKFFSIILLIAAVHLTSVAVTNDNDEPRLTTAEIFNADSIRAYQAYMAKDLVDMGITEALDSNFRYIEYIQNLSPAEKVEFSKKLKKNHNKSESPEGENAAETDVSTNNNVRKKPSSFKRQMQQEQLETEVARHADFEEKRFQNYVKEFSPQFAEFIRAKIDPYLGYRLLTPENTKIPAEFTNRELKELQQIITQYNGLLLFSGSIDGEPLNAPLPEYRIKD